ncbi:bifunctional lysylphosphatidylglycerol flippase/synthetase MprF [Chitinasiproducens palmae]|uniref:Phosphatidylglycerol lysyltransferase n=1 Tax=Chitinasiproducens palmae TaxID=1770053 RepID=A0A1H2PUR4_9BURK|nr:bifunctional lysylphosphatidylglycerol flippase/synthetase MprF [Chitinasiproducens palmae]SDV50537.1 phosphatidylglycerol lysyltransferase [Chitinasiproducens palmae]
MSLSKETVPPRVRRLATPLLALAFCAFLLFLFQRLSQSIDYRSVVRSLRALPPEVWLASLGATALSYVALIARDAAGLRYVGKRVPRVALGIGATVGSALGNATGFGALTGGAVRVRVYGSAGVETADVARLTVFTSVALAFALLLMTGVGLLCSANAMSAALHLGPTGCRLLGALILLLGVAAAVSCGREPRTLRWRRFQFTLPSFRVLIDELLWSVVDVTGAALALWVMLPHTEVGFPVFLAVFAAAMLLGLIGHTPGGLGVFEAAMVIALGHSVPTPVMVAALLAYRAIYFGVPLVVSLLLLVGFEGRALTMRLATRQPDGMTWLVPVLLAIITFGVGGMLVISGATPAYHGRLSTLETVSLPLWVLEGSQLLASMMGVLLLFAARGLLKRLDAAWWLALVLTLVSLFLALAKGLAYVEAAILAVLLTLLLASRRHFKRSSSLFSQRFTAGWLVSVGIVLVVAFWIFFFAFRDVGYRNDLWWEFAFDERAPRALRATVAAGLLAAALAVRQLLRPDAGRFVRPSAADLVDAAGVIRTQERSDAVLAMMADKSFLFSASRRTFLMYAKRGRTWAALHDPVGPRDEWAGLIEQFVALAHSHGGRAAFYQVRADALPLYLDAGLTLMKLGEEAVVDLRAFEMTGSQRQHLRYALKRGERDGLSVEVIERPVDPAWLPVLRRISDAWLDSRSAREKSFSVAAFTPDYLAAQSVMLVRQAGEPVAFVTYMTTDLGVEATIGVMRHLPEASQYAMEYLFTSLILHLKQAGLTNLSLGMAPLSGVHAGPLASPWHRLASLTWHVGGRFYNFRGLRVFKNKFQPRWEPRYLAASGSLSVLLTLADLSLLAGGRRS